jgi:hypothetical protein
MFVCRSGFSRELLNTHDLFAAKAAPTCNKRISLRLRASAVNTLKNQFSS